MYILYTYMHVNMYVQMVYIHVVNAILHIHASNETCRFLNLQAAILLVTSGGWVPTCGSLATPTPKAPDQRPLRPSKPQRPEVTHSSTMAASIACILKWAKSRRLIRGAGYYHQ